jgi:hypothetical protein
MLTECTGLTTMSSLWFSGWERQALPIIYAVSGRTKSEEQLPFLSLETRASSALSSTLMESLLRDTHRMCFDGPDCMLTHRCRVVLSRFQPSQVDLTGMTRPFDPYKGPKSLATYFGIALRFVSYFSRIVVPDEYYFSLAADTYNDVEDQRPEDIIEATDDQLAVWREICDIVRRIRANETEDHDDSDDNNNDDNVLKEQLLDLGMLLICHTTGARRYPSYLSRFCAMLSIEPSTRSWMEPGNFSSTCDWSEQKAGVRYK